ncbi:hypothetical protein BRADI_4g04495v3, partial [Brachypodium distachyon]
ICSPPTSSSVPSGTSDTSSPGHHQRLVAPRAPPCRPPPSLFSTTPARTTPHGFSACLLPGFAEPCRPERLLGGRFSFLLGGGSWRGPLTRLGASPGGPPPGLLVVAPARPTPPPVRAAVALHLGPRSSPEEDGGQTQGHKQTRREHPSRSPGPVLPSFYVSKDIPRVMAGRCFNCLEDDHVSALCQNPTRCRRCGGEGHVARACHATSPVDLATVVPSRSPPSPCSHPAPPARGTSTAAMMVAPGRLAPHALGRVIVPRSPAIQNAEAALRWSLLVSLVGERRRVPVSEARGVISRSCPAVENHFTLHSFWPVEFLCVLDSCSARDALLAVGQVEGCRFSLRFFKWNRQLQARLCKFRFRVHLELDGIPPHAWCKEVAEAILGPACWIEHLGTLTA